MILGNSGSGKTTLARRLAERYGLARLSLDEIAWTDGPNRRDETQARSLLDGFLDGNPRWVVEGCYGGLIVHALRRAEELRFLNPGTAVCVARCHARPWEPEKFATPEEQDAALAHLIDWVRQYETRDDEFGLKRHRRIFEEFGGTKREDAG